LTLFTLALAVALVWWDLGQAAPGDLSLAHSAIDELAGSTGCVVCHGEEGTSLATACGECHAESLADVEQGRGFHGTLPSNAAVTGKECGECHREHHGAELALVSDVGFRLAGDGSQEAFDHGRLGYDPEGVHAELACKDCHANANVILLVEGEERFGAADPACTSCHEDPHEGAIERACQECHGQARPFVELETFEHAASFALEGAHALSAMSAERCTACHESESEFAVEALADVGEGLVERGCLDCHTSPHTKSFLGQTEDPSCSACHETVPGGFGPELAHFGPAGDALEAHRALGFPLETPHDTATCTACHGTLAPAAPSTPTTRTLVPRSAESALFPGRTATDCAACHVDPHANANGASCLDCHQASGPWDDLSAFSHETFPLRGVHSRSSCTACHAKSGPTATAELSARRDQGLTSPPRSCTDCHDDPHDPTFVSEIAQLPDLTEPTCAACHDTTAAPSALGFHINEADFPRDLHTATGMALVDPHTEVACAGCHAPVVPSTSAAESPTWASLRDVAFAEKFRAAEAHRSPDDCGACHANPHGDEFANSPLADSPDDCLACHLPTAFSPSLVDAELHTNTDFPLDGGHLAVGCFGCHEREGTRPCPNFGAAPSACADCHTDIHANAELSDVNGPAAATVPALAGIGCARCHTTEDFHTAAAPARDPVNHAPLFGFELAGAHARAACQSCHRPEPTTSPGAREFGRASLAFPGPVGACATCHADPHAGHFDGPGKPALVAGRTDCARCHGQDSFALDPNETPFDHGLWADFDLAGPHAEAACTACHNQEPYAVAASRLAQTRGTACADCHADIHLGQFASEFTSETDCARCHEVEAQPAFAASLFDHDRDTRYMLDDSHSELDCTTCHRAYPLDGGGEVVRYKPLGTTCADCHGVTPK
jgi:hypothetical protein